MKEAEERLRHLPRVPFAKGVLIALVAGILLATGLYLTTYSPGWRARAGGAVMLPLACAAPGTKVALGEA